MPTTICIGNGFLTFAKTNFSCPVCKCLHEEKDYITRLLNSKHCITYKQCKHCKVKLGISADYMGDTVVWLKSDEKNQLNILKNRKL